MTFEDSETNQRVGGAIKRYLDKKRHNVIAHPGDITHVIIWNPSDRAFSEMATPIGNPPDLIERQLQNLGSGDEADYVSQEIGPDSMKSSGASNYHGVSPDAEFASVKGEEGLVTPMTRGSQSSAPCAECGQFTTPNNSQVTSAGRVHYRCKQFITDIPRW